MANERYSRRRTNGNIHRGKLIVEGEDFFFDGESFEIPRITAQGFNRAADQNFDLHELADSFTEAPMFHSESDIFTYLAFPGFETKRAPEIGVLRETLAQRELERTGTFYVGPILRAELKRKAEDAARVAYIQAGDPALAAAFHAQQHAYIGGESGCIGCAA